MRPAERDRSRVSCDLAAVAALADVVQSRRSTATRLAAEVALRTRIPAGTG